MLPLDSLGPVLVWKTVSNRIYPLQVHQTAPGSLSNPRVVAPGDVRTLFFKSMISMAYMGLINRDNTKITYIGRF